MYHEACLGWLGSEEGRESSESLMYRKQWKMYNQFIVVGNFLQFEVLMKGLNVPKPRSSSGFGRRKRQAESSVDAKAVYSKVMKVLTAKFKDEELSDDQGKKANDIINKTKAKLYTYSFAVLGLINQGELSSADMVETLAEYKGDMTEAQSNDISQLVVDFNVRYIVLFRCLPTLIIFRSG